MLRLCRVVLVRDDGTIMPSQAVETPHSPLLKWVQITASPDQRSKTEYLLQIGIHGHYYDQRIPHCLQNGISVSFFPVLFQVGVDIRQWGANTGSQMKNQFGGDGKPEGASSGGLLDEEDDDVGISDDDVLVGLNFEALQKLNTYAHAISPIQGGAAAITSGISAGLDSLCNWGRPQEEQSLSGGGMTPSVHPSLSMLHSHIVTSAGKMNHSILDEAATMAQQLGGGGVVFCKSGKDRTAMHVTYKQAQVSRARTLV